MGVQALAPLGQGLLTLLLVSFRIDFVALLNRFWLIHGSSDPSLFTLVRGGTRWLAASLPMALFFVFRFSVDISKPISLVE